jgi:hypothetical protein
MEGKMGKSILPGIAGILVLIAVIFTGCPTGGGGGGGDPAVKVTGVTLSASDGSGSGSSVIYLGGTTAQLPASLSFTAAAAPANASNKAVKWTVTPDTFVNWDETTRTVTAKALGGPTTVTVKTVDGGFTGIWTVTVADPASHVGVTSVQIIYSGSSLAFEKTDSGFNPASITLVEKVLPENATNKAIKWSVEPAGIVTVVSGLVTPVSLGNAVITLSSIDNPNAKATINVSVSEEEIIPPSDYELKLVNQSASPAEGTTLTLPDMDAATKRYTIANAFNSFSSTATPWTGAGWAGGNADTGVFGTTVVYLDKGLGNNASISARVRIIETFGTGADSGGIIVGMFKNPVGASNAPASDIKFCGIRLTTNTSATADVRMYATRDQGSSGGINNSAAAYSPVLLNGYVDNEYIVTVTRTAANTYTLKVADANGTQLASGTRGSNINQIIDLGNAYPGFIIARAKVEISQIIITEDTDTIFQTATSAPTLFPVESIEFTDPAVAATATPGEFECGHSTLNGDNLTISAKILPARAAATINWNVVSGPATLSASTGESVDVSFTGEGKVVVTASAGDKSIKLTIDVTADSIPVTGITISAAGGKTSIMAGDGTVPPVTLQFSEVIDPLSATDPVVTWSLSSTSAFDTATTVSGCSISNTGLLTAPANYTGADFTIYVFATAVNDGGNAVSAGTPITVKQYAVQNIIYNFSTAPLNTLSTSATTEEITLGGLTLGTGVNLLAQNATAPDGSGLSNFTYCLRTGGGANATQRYIVIPLNGPATITVYGASNNSSATSFTVTSTVASTASLGSMALPAWNSSALGTPTYTSTTSDAHTVVLKSAASARIFAIKVEY